MYRTYGGNRFLVRPADLIAFAWSAPMRDLAAKLGMSDVGLKKLLRTKGIATPPQGYWNKVHAGKPVPKAPEPSPRGPGHSGLIDVDARFEGLVPSSKPIPSTGPFASALVPEDLDKLRARELEALTTFRPPKSLRQPHKSLVPILRKDQRRRERKELNEWHWDSPRYDNPLEKRRLKILNAIFGALDFRGHEGDAYESDSDLNIRATIGNTVLGLVLEPCDKLFTHTNRSQVQAASKTALKLQIIPDYSSRDRTDIWREDQDGKLDANLPAAVADIIVAGEAKFRRSLREAEEREEQSRIDQERRQRELLELLNQQRVEQLFMSGEQLRQAQEIRALVEQVRIAMIQGGANLDPVALQKWEQWALGEADKIDPILSGQYLEHFEEPEP
ncbi:hypothetical protein ACLIR7_09580 [Nitratireductor aquimarinus]|uniref:hypothetical protein n=1 Tax=Nitratireductor aquimarinus TaxID=889300 RepID=UPI00398F6B95